MKKFRITGIYNRDGFKLTLYKRKNVFLWREVLSKQFPERPAMGAGAVHFTELHGFYCFILGVVSSETVVYTGSEGDLFKI